MKTLLAFTVLIIATVSHVAFAQSQITSGVNFFRGNDSWMPLKSEIAAVSANGLGLFRAEYDSQKTNSIKIEFTAAKNSGLTYWARVSFFNPRFSTDVSSFDGQLDLTSCVRENGQTIFGQFKSLEEVLKYSHENANSTQFSSCVFTGAALSANWTTPNGSQPRPTFEDVKMYVFADHVEISGTFKGAFEKPVSFKSPYIFYSAAWGGSLRNVRSNTLAILEKAMSTLQGEVGDQQLPKTVAYVLENRVALTDALKQLEGQNVNNLELIEFSVSVKNAFHILDQAVGLASNRQIQMNQLIGTTK